MAVASQRPHAWRGCEAQGFEVLWRPIAGDLSVLIAALLGAVGTRLIDGRGVWNDVWPFCYLFRVGWGQERPCLVFQRGGARLMMGLGG